MYISLLSCYRISPQSNNKQTATVVNFLSQNIPSPCENLFEIGDDVICSVGIKIKGDSKNEVETILTENIKLSPQNAANYLKRAKLRMYCLDNIGGAMKDLNRAIEISPKLGESYCLRGYLKTWQESSMPAKSGNSDFRKARRLGCLCGKTN